MQTVQFTCPNCKKQMSAPNIFAGYVLSCTFCDAKFYFLPESFEINQKKKNSTKAIKKLKESENKSAADKKTKQNKKSEVETVELDLKDQKFEQSEKEAALKKGITGKITDFVKSKIAGSSEQTDDDEDVLAKIKNADKNLFVSITGIFGALVIVLALFLPAIRISETEQVSLFSAAFNLKQLGAVLSVIAPEKLLFFLIVLIPVFSVISIISDVKSVIKKRVGVLFYRVLLILVTLGYFLLTLPLLIGGGIKFDEAHKFVSFFESAYENGGLGGILKNIFGTGFWFLIFGLLILIVVSLLDFINLVKRKRIET